MERSLRLFWFFSLMVIALYSFHAVNSISVPSLDGSNSNDELETKLMNRMEGLFRQQLDSEIKRLNAEIEQLKMEMVDLKAKNADQAILMNRILSAQVVNNNPKSVIADGQRLPPSDYLTDIKENRNDAREVLTPSAAPVPTSCNDMRSLPYNYASADKNNYYLVARKNRIWVVYCTFFPQGSIADTEKEIGYIDVKNSSSSVYFHVQRNSPYRNVSTPITYQKENLNIGTAMNITSGIFTAPTNGVYYFSFVSISYADGTNAVILRKNGQNIATSLVPSINYNPSISATLQLNKTDQIDVYLYIGSILDDNNFHYTQFSGILLEEYLDL